MLKLRKEFCNAELEEKLAGFNQAYLEEKDKSLGYLPAMDYTLTRQAEPAAQPERNLAGSMVLGGALLGAVLFSALTLFSCRKQRG